MTRCPWSLCLTFRWVQVGRVATWLEENTFEDKSLKDLVIEAIDFAGKFAAEIAEHPLNVYYTALPLLPPHSMLYRLFHDSLVDPSVLLVTIPGSMHCLALSANGRRIVTGNIDHAIVRDTATGEELAKMASTDGNAYPFSVAFSYDGSRIACGTWESTVYVWDSVTGARVIGPLSHSGSSPYVNVVAWSTDGECLLSGCQTGEVILWNITSPNGNQPITKIHHPGCSHHENHLSSLVFSSDGSQITSCSRRGDVHVWDSKTGGIMWSVQDPQGSDPSGGISFLSSDTREFIVVKTKERTQARDASTGDLCPLPDSLAGAVGLTRDGRMPSGPPDVNLQSAMTTHGLPAKLTTTNRGTSRPSTARFFSRGSTNGAEGPNVTEVASRALIGHPSATAMHNCFGGAKRDATIFRITGGNDKQGFPVKLGVLLPYRSSATATPATAPAEPTTPGASLSAGASSTPSSALSSRRRRARAPDNILPKRLVPMPAPPQTPRPHARDQDPQKDQTLDTEYDVLVTKHVSEKAKLAVVKVSYNIISSARIHVPLETSSSHCVLMTLATLTSTGQCPRLGRPWRPAQEWQGK
ncbi:YVTN repeat-like/Quino protein amine dehydrogenase, partial [Athelia psychrophila]